MKAVVSASALGAFTPVAAPFAAVPANTVKYVEPAPLVSPTPPNGQFYAYEVVGYKLDKLTLDTELSDLSLDSVAVMEIVGYVEQKLGVRFNDEDMATITTLRDLSTLIEKAKS